MMARRLEEKRGWKRETRLEEIQEGSETSNEIIDEKDALMFM